MSQLQKTPASTPTPTTQDWDPFRMMREFMGTGWPGTLASLDARLDRFSPSFDVKETREGYVFKADVPGVAENDLEVTCQGNRLRIAGKREQEKEDKGDTWYTLERSHGSFARVFTLPDTADGEKAHAEVKSGVLKVFVPRKPEVKSTRVAVKNAG